MPAVTIHAAHDLRLDTAPLAAAPEPGEATVRVARGGICGSDLHYYHDGGFGTVRVAEPMILGHEASGTVAAVGPGVPALDVGDRVAINPSMPCGVCDYCRAGMRNHCSDMRFAGSAMRTPHQQGFFRDALTLPAGQLVRLAPTTDLGAAACAEPFAVCLHAAGQAGPLEGRRVLVSGAGPIGCLMVLAARHLGAGEIVATDLGPAPLAVAAQLGATATHDLKATPDALAPLATGKGTLDVAFECSGSAAGLAACLRVLRAGGILVAVGLGGDVTVPLGLAVTKEITLRGSFRFDTEFAEAARLIDTGAVDVGPLITDVLPATDARAAFDRASDRSRAMKVQLAFDPDREPTRPGTRN